MKELSEQLLFWMHPLLSIDLSRRMFQHALIIAPTHSNALIRMSRNYSRSRLENATQTNLMRHAGHYASDMRFTRFHVEKRSEKQFFSPAFRLYAISHCTSDVDPCMSSFIQSHKRSITDINHSAIITFGFVIN